MILHHAQQMTIQIVSAERFITSVSRSATALEAKVNSYDNYYAYKCEQWY